MVSTRHLALAKTFGSKQEAIDYYMQTSKVRPIREDGKPNRPLTCFSATFASLEAMKLALTSLGMPPEEE